MPRTPIPLYGQVSKTFSDNVTLTDSLTTNYLKVPTSIVTQLQIEGTVYEDFKNLKIKRSMSDFGTTSSFRIDLDSPYGRHAGEFNIGDEVVVYADFKVDPTEAKLFTGIVEEIKYEGSGTKQRLILTGRDYSARLMDITVNPVVYTDTEVSTIVTQILSDNHVPDITTNNVDTTNTTLRRIAFNHKTVFEALKQLAELSGYIFYVDKDKDLHFEERRSVSSGITLDNTNIVSANFYSGKEGMANSVWVYGDRFLSGFKEVIPTDGGSAFNLLYNPHNTQIESSNDPGSLLIGGIFGITTSTTSGPNYLVNYHDKEIIFVSGTTVGYNSIPTSGGSFVADYQRELPIVKYAQDDTSINIFGLKESVIIDKSIKDPDTALDLARGKISDANPLKRIETNIKIWLTSEVGQTVGFVMDDYDINQIGGDEVSILEIEYNFNTNTIQNNNVITLKLSKKVSDITDKIRDIDERLRGLESEASASDIITRLLSSEENLKIVGSRWTVQTSTTTGSGYHLYSTTFTPPVNPFHLASGTDQGLLAGSFTGSASVFGPFTVIAESGINYSVTGSYNEQQSEGGQKQLQGFG